MTAFVFPMRRSGLMNWLTELQRYFDVYELLNEQSASRIYEECSSRLQSSDYSVRNLLRRSNVKVVCTTDDPLDTLDFHRQIKQDNFEIKVLPAFRPDKAMGVDKAEDFNGYLSKLERVCDTDIISYADYIMALRSRHDFFSTRGCSVADHSMEQMYVEEYTEKEIEIIFATIRNGKELDLPERKKIKSALLHHFTVWNWEKGWVQQFHLGALRNNNSRLFRSLGPDTGFDSIGDFSQARSLAKFLDKLDSKNQLTRTIIYNLNPRDNELMAAMTGNFNDGSIKGKVQFGSGWWF
ncbi:MAG: glucuronate isomerase, partial [Bacteroidota bacterium]